MNYKLEISDTRGDGFAVEEDSLIESDSPIPIPQVGDTIYFPNGTGAPDSTTAAMAVVKWRRFVYFPQEFYVQVFCEDATRK